ncbi:hypothetical protein ACJZ2D_015129 [Fusarium nematophilum]
MALSPDVIFDIASACVCAALIVARCVYRVLFRCKLHPTCHRTWRIDDFYMTIAMLPLVGRATCISLSFVLNPSHTYEPATDAEALARGVSVDIINNERILSHKLLIPGRICYALFLWCLKLGLLAFYSRFVGVFPWGKLVCNTLWCFIVLSFVAVLVTTLLECRPLSLMWALNFEDTSETCHRALRNLILMAVCNIISDVALIILPFPILKHLRLDLKAKLQLGFLFGIGGVVVAITILRLPLIFDQSVSQKSRSMWASIEILCACVVANTPLFYALLKDLQRRHDDRTAGTSANRRDFYLQSLPSEHPNPSESSKGATINLNALIAVLAPIFRASIAFVAFEVISQLKWDWVSARTRPMPDLQLFNDASYGAYSSLKLLPPVVVCQPIALGAIVVAVVSLAIGPFMQQTIQTYQCHQLVDLSAEAATITTANRIDHTLWDGINA